MTGGDGAGWANVLVQTAWVLGVEVDQSVKSLTKVRLVIMMHGQGLSRGTGDVALAGSKPWV